MAVVQNTLIGRSKGRVGNAVFSQWKGLNILKQLPTIVSNPRSAQQQANRARFTMLLAIGKLLMSQCKVGFKEFSGTITWLNKFMSINVQSGLAVWNALIEGWEIDYTKLVISDGSLLPTALTISSATATGITVDWNPSILGNQYNDDKFIGIMISEGKTETFTIEDRVTGTTSITTALTVAADVFVCGFFIRNDGTIVSSSHAVSATVV